MPANSNPEVLTKGSPSKHCTEWKCEPEKRRCDDKHRSRRHSKSPDKKVVVKLPEAKKHIIEKLKFSVSTTGILVPAGATHMKITMVGGGGGGGKFKSICSENLHGGGGGGAAGTYIKEALAVKPGKAINIKIGAGGKGGNDENGGNGRDGCETKLTYDCHTKVAYGGRGGVYNLNGGFGGKGGCGTGTGRDGRSGKDGCLGGRGGKGGEIDCKPCTTAGDGGVGGSDPELSSNSDSCAKKEPVVGPNGANGANGFCELVFFREGPACDVAPYCVDPIQHIVACDRDTTHWVNPDAKLVIVDTSNAPARLSLGKPQKELHRLVIKMLHQNGLPVYINVGTGGTFALSANNPAVTLDYADCVWDVAANFQNVHSFYPTTQQGPTQAVECVINSDAESSSANVAISADGNTMVIGVEHDNGEVGAAWIYVRRHKCWEKQAKLVGSNSVGSSQQGSAVAISADGNTVAIGGPRDNDRRGAVWIFVREGCKWHQEGAKLVDCEEKTTSFGDAVALTADGNTLVVGVPSFGNEDAKGKVVIFKRNGCSWKKVDTISQDSCEAANSQGTEVAISAAGDVLAVGAVGKIYIWNLTHCGWKQVAELKECDGGENYGTVFALSADGRTLAVGTFSVPCVYIYVNNGGIWTRQGIPLVGQPKDEDSRQGRAVALSADGNTLAVGDTRSGNVEQGVVYIFTRTAGTWTQQEALSGAPHQNNTRQGAGVALSSEGNTLAVVNQSETPLFWVWV